MAVTAEIWVRAHLRRCFAAGLTGAVVRRGAAEAGTIFVRVNLADGRVRLFGAPPGSAYDPSGERCWIAVMGEEPAMPDDAESYLQRQLARDPDIWIVDIDDREGRGLLRVIDPS